MNIEGLSLDQMRVALVVAEAGSLSGAARRFNRAQSAVSYAVTTLERQLGVQLFDRSTQRARPTSAAGPLLREMKAIVSRADALRESARLLREGDDSTIVIGVDALYPLAALAGAMAAFQKAFPAIVIEVQTGLGPVIVDRVIGNLCGLGIVTAPTVMPEPLVSEPLAPVTLIPVVSGGRRSSAAGSPVVAEFELGADIRVVMPSEKFPSPFELGHIQSRTWCVDDMTTKLAFLRAGLGWGYMPRHLVQGDIDHGILNVIVRPGIQSEHLQSIHLVRKADRALALPAQWLAEHLPHRTLRS